MIDPTKSEAYALLKDLVSFPSTEGNESGISDYIAQYAQKIGMDVEQQEVETGRKNVIARVKIGCGGKTVVLNAHMDVVPPADGWNTDPFKLEIKGDKVYGRGSTDDKGSLTSFLLAVKHIINNPGVSNGNIIFTAVVDEESFSKGARFLAASGKIKADYGIVGEPTVCAVWTGHKGSIRPVIVIKGKTAHSAMPELGISSVRIASYISGLVDEIQKGLRAKKMHPIAGSPSCVITMIRAGVKENVVPDWCELTIDRRMVPGEDEEEIKQVFNKLCKDAEIAFPGAKVYVDHYLVTTGPASEVKPDSKIAQIARAAAKSVTGEDSAFGIADCNTDMNHFVRIGIPCVIIGPGLPSVMHIANEYIDLNQIERCSKIHEAVIRALFESR